MDKTNKGPVFSLGQVAAGLKRGTSPFAQMLSDLKPKPSFEALDKSKAEKRLKYFFKMSALNPKGFRVPSSKHGPRGPLTAPDRLLMDFIGPSAMPKATRSPRKIRKAERRKDYLHAVRNNPKYPSGDRRTKV